MEFYYLLLDKSNERLIYSQINILFKKIKTILKYYLDNIILINIKISFFFVFSNLFVQYNKKNIVISNYLLINTFFN